jgi:acetoin utilization protein AcuB
MGKKVGDHMSTDVIVTHTGLQLSDAVRMMKLNQIRHLCVMSAGGQLVGIVSDRDVSRALPSALVHGADAEYTRVLENTRVGHIMTRVPVVASPQLPLARAALLMRERHIDALPVVEGGELVGILTSTDCLSVLAEEAGA